MVKLSLRQKVNIFIKQLFIPTVLIPVISMLVYYTYCYYALNDLGNYYNKQMNTFKKDIQSTMVDNTNDIKKEIKRLRTISDKSESNYIILKYN